MIALWALMAALACAGFAVFTEHLIARVLLALCCGYFAAVFASEAKP